MGRLFRRCQFTARRVFPGLDNGDPWEEEALEPLPLRQVAARWQGSACPLCQALLRRLAFRGRTQAAHVPGLVDHEEAFARGTLRLAAVRCLGRCGSGRAVERPFRTSMPNRGIGEVPSGVRVVTIAAHSAAVRAGSPSGAAHA
jgi:hypothetical protein